MSLKGGNISFPSHFLLPASWNVDVMADTGATFLDTGDLGSKTMDWGVKREKNPGSLALSSVIQPWTVKCQLLWEKEINITLLILAFPLLPVKLNTK